MHTVWRIQLLHKYEKDKGMVANHHKLHKGDASRMMVITKQPQPKDLSQELQ